MKKENRERVDLLPLLEAVEDTELKEKLKCKYRQLKNLEGHTYTHYRRASLWNTVAVVCATVFAVAVPSSAMVVDAPIVVRGLEIAPQTLTGLLGLGSAAVLAAQQAFRLQSQQTAFLSLHNQAKTMRDKLCYLVRTEEELKILVQEHNSVRGQWSEILRPADFVEPSATKGS